MTQQLERRFVNDYAWEHLQNVHWQTRVRLGPLPPGKEAAEYSVVGRWADVLVFEPNRVTIIEAKLEPNAKAVGQLDEYAKLFTQTLRFQRYWDSEIRKVLLTTRIDDSVREVCTDHNVWYEVYRPEWIKYWEKRRFKL